MFTATAGKLAESVGSLERLHSEAVLVVLVQEVSGDSDGNLTDDISGGDQACTSTAENGCVSSNSSTGLHPYCILWLGSVLFSVVQVIMLVLFSSSCQAPQRCRTAG